MKRPNKVFFLCSEYNNLNNIAALAHGDYIELMHKAMCIGFGPYPAVSLEVVGGVATLTLAEEVTIHPGVKLVISGSGVVALDGLQEVDSIGSTTLTYRTDALDGVYSTNITYSYPSLGWTMLYKTADRIVLKSGASGSQEHCVLFALGKTLVNVCEAFAYKVKNPRSVFDFESISPPLLTGFQTNFKVGKEANAGYKQVWFFYGDDAFVIQGHKISNLANDYISDRLKAGFNTLCYGELKKTTSSAGNFFMRGSANEDCTTYAVEDYHNDLMYNCGLYKSWSLTSGPDSNGYAVKSRILCDGYYETRSGNGTLNNTMQKTRLNVRYMGLFVMTETNKVEGFVPGLYFVMQKPVLLAIKNTLNILYPLKANGSLSNRKVYGMYGSMGEGFASAGGFDPAGSSVTVLDLTGPIR